MIGPVILNEVKNLNVFHCALCEMFRYAQHDKVFNVVIERRGDTLCSPTMERIEYAVTEHKVR